MTVHRALAPAKVNLGLFLGASRPHDGKHELVTVMLSISLADELTLEPRADPGDGGDEVLCPGLDGPPSENLALRALQAFRRVTGWEAPPQRLVIEKRIPVAAGLGGGSADAAGALRLAAHASGLGDQELLLQIATTLGADVPAQITPGCWLATGAGEELRALPDPGDSLAFLILPYGEGLSTGAVYEEADRLAIPRTAEALQSARAMVEAAWEGPGARDAARGASGAREPAGGASGAREAAHPVLTEELLHNDLQQPAVLLCPGILDRLTRARASQSDLTVISGSGPTVIGVFTGPAPAAASEGASGAASPTASGLPLERARAAAEGLSGLVPAPIAAHPVDGAFARAWTEGEAGSPPDGPLRHNHSQTRDE
jgi:4-diphosphocytidyl-2-C-methyl-D-erythritol kinase